MSKPSYGMIGLGTMGRNLSLNIAEKGYRLAIYNRTASVTNEMIAEAGEPGGNLVATYSLSELVDAMAAPRTIILMVPAGPIVDDHITRLRELLDDDDLIIDAGNAHFPDTNRRAAQAREAGRLFLGIGVSGGAEGARHGPSIMGGGDRTAWDRVAPLLKAISARYEDQPCADYMGPTGSGHFVKMVHNGIEYADMQMIAEVYGLMRDGLKLATKDIATTFATWNKGPLQSYLIEISGTVASTTDAATGKPILDVILDSAGQKGTGRWTAIEALHLASPVTAIDAAVAARNFSSRLEERARGQDLFGAAPGLISSDRLQTSALEQALLAGKIACYAQGFAMLQAGSVEYDWQLPLPEIAEVWREGCIIRSAMLNDMATALRNDAGQNLMFSAHFADLLKASHGALRQVVAIATETGHPVPALSAAVSYFDTMRTARGTANMIQAQRDFFGAHSFQRLDKEGTHHGPWVS